MFKRIHIPWAEIYLKKGPIAWVILPNRELIPFDIGKSRNGFFVLYNNKIKGIFKIDRRHIFFMGKTPCYFYDTKNMNPIDPILCDELNKFCDRNNLTKLKQKDVRASQVLRGLVKRRPKDRAITEMRQTGMEKQKLIDQALAQGNSELAKQLEDFNKEHESNVKFNENQTSIFLLQYLAKQDLLPEKEKETFIYKVENEMITFEELLNELKTNNIITIQEPLDMDPERFLIDFGSQDPLNMSGHVDDLRADRKGLSKMTATPVKSFIPAATIFAIGLVIVMAIAILPGQMDTIQAAFGGIGGGESSFKLPFGLGG